MLKKRLVGVITVKDGLAVQSFGYRKYLPMGRPDILAENLDRWGADEIILQCINRSRQHSGPDFALLEQVASKGLSTPLIYSGGIHSVEEGVAVIQSGADRICLDALLHDAPEIAVALSECLGSQALIAALPLSVEPDGLVWLDYRTGHRSPLSPALLDVFRVGALSEALIIDWRHEGFPCGFDMSLLSHFPLSEIPLIAFGGLSEGAQLREALQSSRVVATAVGNFLSYREQAVALYKQQLGGLPIREPYNDYFPQGEL